MEAGAKPQKIKLSQVNGQDCRYTGKLDDIRIAANAEGRVQEFRQVLKISKSGQTLLDRVNHSENFQLNLNLVPDKN